MLCFVEKYLHQKMLLYYFCFHRKPVHIFISRTSVHIFAGVATNYACSQTDTMKHVTRLEIIES